MIPLGMTAFCVDSIHMLYLELNIYDAVRLLTTARAAYHV